MPPLQLIVRRGSKNVPNRGAEPRARRVAANGRVGGEALAERAVWQLLREYAAQARDRELAPHDLRRTAAKLCRAKGGELELPYGALWGIKRLERFFQVGRS
jgi:integrase